MARSIYITSAEGHSGKSTVALGVLDTLTHQIQRVGVFRPIARSIVERDYVLDFVRTATAERGLIKGPSRRKSEDRESAD